MNATIPTISRLLPNVIRILGCNPGPMTLQGTNTYLLGTGEERMLIDAGDQDIPDYIQNLSQVLQQENAVISKILISHWHHDHIGGVKDIFREIIKNACEVWKYPQLETVNDYSNAEEFKILAIKDGQNFSVQGAEVKAFHTPGHTTDHVIFRLTKENIIFSGDCILGEGTAVFEDLFDYMKSLQVIKNLNPCNIYPGHGNIVQEPVTKISFYIDHRNAREQQIKNIFLENIDEKFEAFDIVKVIYKDTPENLLLAAENNVIQHLKKLQREDFIQIWEDKEKGLWKYFLKSSL